jgi:hypothetical protein
MAPKSTRNQTRDAEQDVQTSSSRTQATESIENMSANQPTDAQQLAEAQEQLRLLQEQLDQARLASQRSTPLPSGPNNSTLVKLKDPDPLTDGVSPTFENWKIQIEDKFLINSYMFNSTQARMAYIFNRTADIAQKHLAPRYRKGPEPFATDGEMILYLAEIFENPFEAQDARIDFRKLTMKEDETFSDFYTQFLHLASLGRIPMADLQPDLYDKLTPALQRCVLPFLDTLLTSEALSKKCLSVDKNLQRLIQRQSRIRIARSSVRTTTTASGPRAPATSLVAQPVGRTTSPTPISKLYGPTRESTPVRKDHEVICYACKQPGHFANSCPEAPKPQADVKELAKPSVPTSDSEPESGNEAA